MSKKEDDDWVELTPQEVCEQLVLCMAALLRSDPDAPKIIDDCYDEAELLAWGTKDTLRSIN